MIESLFILFFGIPSLAGRGTNLENDLRRHGTSTRCV
jgi:hypothetical protein